MKTYLVTLGYDYGDAEYGPKYSSAEVLIDAESAEEAEDIADQEYGYPATGEPYDGCWAREATQSDIDRLSRSTDWDDAEFPFDPVTGNTIQAVEGIDGYGEYDGTPASYFTRDDIVDFAFDVIDKLNDRTGVTSGPRPIENWWDLNEVYFDDDGYTLCVYLVAPSGEDFQHEARIDMRRAHDAKSLIRAYSEEFAQIFESMYNNSNPY